VEPANTSPVSVHVVGTAPGTVTVEVGVDPAWLAAPGRQFPVTVDPLLAWSKTAGTGGTVDTYVVGGTSAGTSFGSSPYLGLGSSDGGVTTARRLLWFDVSSLVSADDSVTNAHLHIDNWASGSCSARGVTLSGLASSFSSSTTWNTQPGLDAAGVVSTTTFAYGATGCAGNWADLDATSLAQRWLGGGGHQLRPGPAGRD
jgi:hypothetical protein